MWKRKFSRWINSSLFSLFLGAALSGVTLGQSVGAPPSPPAAVDLHEDWTSLSLADSHLVAVAPAVGEKDDLEEFSRELIQVQWRPLDPIQLYVVLPKGVKKPPVILYLYGHPAETTRFLDDDFCRLLVKNGYAAVGFVPNLSGQRYHTRPMKEWYVSELQEALVTSTHDVQMILNYLETRGDVDMSRAGIFCYSAGGST